MGVKPAARRIVPGFVWLDHDGRIRRMSYAAEAGDRRDPALWHITEFWDFGVTVDRESPRVASQQEESIRRE